jgi:D-alanyl-D-alanine carboxypeptidase/D-alanyl-D-alanine-endopeptidase (penicillin-binding protein 4)
MKKVEGNLIADDSYFDGERRVPTWHKKGNTRAYDAPLGALSFNFNTVTAFVSPGKSVGAPGQIILEPDTKYTRLKNRLKTVSKKTHSRVILDRIDRGTHDEISLSGVIAQNMARKKYYVNITDPPKYSATVFKQYLERAGVSVTGTVETGTVPKEARILWTHESEPLSLTLNGLLKFSNNFVAEQILKALAAKRFGPPGTTENGLRILAEYMQDLGYDPGQFKIADSSGLSRKSRLSPHQIVQVLEQVRQDLSIYPEFISALGAMGVDGNVRKRMKGIENANRVRAKTGTLDYISTLSGYFQAQDGEVFAFSFLMNDLKCSTATALKIQDRLVREGLRFQRTPSRP